MGFLNNIVCGAGQFIIGLIEQESCDNNIDRRAKSQQNSPGDRGIKKSQAKAEGHEDLGL